MHASPDREKILTASFDNAVGLWEIGADAPIRWLDGHDAAVNTAIFVLGAWGSTFTCGSCTILNPVISVPVPVSAGDASLPVPLGCDMSLFGGTFAVQWWPVGTSATPCAFLPTVSFSNTFNGQVGF